MRRLTRLYHGKRLQGIRCSFCGVKRDGVVFREDYYWRKHLSCGHVIGGSFVLPPSELIRMGFVNRNDGERDPRAVAQTVAIINDAKTAWQQRRKARWIKENLPMGRRYL